MDSREQTIRDYFSKEADPDAALRRLAQTLPAPGLGETQVDQLYRQVVIRKQVSGARK